MKVVGRKPVLELLESSSPVQRVSIMLETQGRIIGQIIALAKQRGIRIDRVPRERVKQVFGTGNHQGVMAEISPFALYNLNDLGTTKIPIRNNLLVALDGVTDPYHLGAIARNAFGAGGDALILPRRRNAPLTDTSIKTSAGTLLKLPVIMVGNLTDTLTRLKKDDWWIIGASGEGKTNLWRMDWNRKTALILGSEGKGLSLRVKAICDDLVSIPLNTALDSLSVSSAAAVILFEIVRQRQFHK